MDKFQQLLMVYYNPRSIEPRKINAETLKSLLPQLCKILFLNEWLGKRLPGAERQRRLYVCRKL